MKKNNTKPKRLCGWVPEDIDNLDTPIICGKSNIYTSPSPKKTFIFIKILGLVTVLVLGTIFLPRLLANKIKPTNETSSTSIPVISQSVCDEVLKLEDLAPVKIYKGKSAKVDFSTYPAAKSFYTAITSQALEGSNFAGHFTYVGWGCGTDCAGYAIVDSISGKIVEYVPFNEDGNSYSYNESSRLFVLNPKEDFEQYRGKTIDEILKDDTWYAHSVRTYYALIEKDNGEVWINKVCSENALDGVYALGNKEEINQKVITPVVEPTVVYYAKIKRVSTSGDVRFYWYDTKTDIIKNPDDQYAWFFALPPTVPDNEKMTDDWVQFIVDNENAVFKISGNRIQDDCGYYGSDHCIQNIDIKTIEVVGTNIKMEF